MTGEGASPAEHVPHKVGRYELFGRIAKGGMASVHLGRVIGARHFARVVAIKKLHEQYASDADFRQMFLNEAEILARIRHPSVVPTLDLIEQRDALYIVMEFVEGVTLKDLQALAARLDMRVPWKIALSILENALRGLHAAHEARDERGEPLELVHRDVSPANILVGNDGMARVFDFGIAKAIGKVQTTQDGQVKGTVPYMTPEQLAGEPVTRRSDVFAASVVLWETLTGRRLFASKDVGQTMHRLLTMEIAAPSTLVKHLPAELDAVVMRGLDRDPTRRFATAADMADALRQVGPPAVQTEVAEWVQDLAEERLDELAALVRSMEGTAPLPDGAVGSLGEPGGRAVERAGRGVTHRASSARTPLSLEVDTAAVELAARGRRRRLGWLTAGATATLVAMGLLWFRGPAQEPVSGMPDAEAVDVESSQASAVPRETSEPAAATEAHAVDAATTSASAAASADAGAAVPQRSTTPSRPAGVPGPGARPKHAQGSPLYSIE